MGNHKSTLIYSKKISQDSENETGIYRNPLTIASQELTYSYNPYILTLQDAFLQTLSTHKNKSFLGTRDQNGLYVFKTFQQINDISVKLGSILLQDNLVPLISEYKDHKLRFIGIFSKNREEYFICELACILFGFTSVSFYETLSIDAIEFILHQTNLTTIFCSKDTLEHLKSLTDFSNLQTIICFDQIDDQATFEFFANKNIKLCIFHQLLGKSFENSSNSQKLPKISPENFYTFSYTSGTTGTPKAAMLSHRNFISLITGLKQTINLKSDDVHLSYLPMAHIFEKAINMLCISEGSSIGFYSGDVLKLKDDLQALHPTVFASVPRVFDRFYEAMKKNIENLEGFQGRLAKRAINSKLNSLKNDNNLTHAIYDRIIFKKIKQVFGGKVRLMATGSAPLSSDIIDFLKIANSCPLFEGYGLTESTGVSFVTIPSDNSSGHVGGPLINTEFKLRAVEDTNYNMIQEKQGPQMGEILIRGPGVCAGYYKDEEKTKKIIDEEGWLHTGDIGLLLSNGALKIIDRIANCFKLSHGEFVAVEKIERLFLQSNLIAEIFIYGDSFESYIVAIAVPKREALFQIAEELKIKGNFHELCRDKDVVNAFLKQMEIYGKAQGLKGFEIVKKILLEPESFAKKDLFTSSFKFKRYKAKDFYAKEIKEMYSK